MGCGVPETHRNVEGMTEKVVPETHRNVEGMDDLEKLAELVYRRSDGNPFFIQEMLHTLVERGDIAGIPSVLQSWPGIDGVVRPGWPGSPQ